MTAEVLPFTERVSRRDGVATVVVPFIRSDFFWHRVFPRVIAVVDVNVGGMSVTNDAEHVIQYLANVRRVLQDDDVVVYRDSEGNWDRMLHRGGEFAGFDVLHATDLKSALTKIAVAC